MRLYQRGTSGSAKRTLRNVIDGCLGGRPEVCIPVQIERLPVRRLELCPKLLQARRTLRGPTPEILEIRIVAATTTYLEQQRLEAPHVAIQV